jgi:2-polyprenyl-3-methyl-5-hydroxy-6-metoxy-1,4-benzoquinol methylase
MEYHDKPLKYFDGCRKDLISIAASKGNDLCILEIGAGTGSTLAQLKIGRIASYTVGIDIMDLKDSNGLKHLIDEFIVADLEHLNIERFQCFFDVIIAGDVLEHLLNPWKIVGKLKRCLRKGGYFIASIPNIAYHKVLRQIVFAQQFTYLTEGGIMDVTHFRFFAKNNMIDLFERNGLKVEKIQSVQAFYRQSSLIRRIALMLTFGWAEPFFTTQYLIEAKNV